MMIVGSVMVVAAVVIMLGVIHAGASGTLRKKNFRKNESLNPAMGNISTEDLFAETTIATLDNW
jgi:hypothetical protein